MEPAKPLEPGAATTPRPARTREDDEILDLGAAQARQITDRVERLTVRLKKIVTTDEGKLQIVMETEGIDDEATLSGVKDMLVLQQAGAITVAMKPLQRDLFDG